MQTGALLLDGNTLNYFGKNIPINLVLAVVAEVVLLGGAEYYRITNGLVCTKYSSDVSFITNEHILQIVSKISLLTVRIWRTNYTQEVHLIHWD